MLITRNARVPDLTPWRDLSTLPDRVARMLGQPFFSDFATEPSFFNPAIDVAEKDDNLVITAELPGLKKEEVELEIEKGVLTIRGEKKEKKEEKTTRMYVIERSYGMFERAFALPQYLDLDKVNAEFENGVLVVKIPKVEHEKGRKVEILNK